MLDKKTHSKITRYPKNQLRRLYKVKKIQNINSKYISLEKEKYLQSLDEIQKKYYSSNAQLEKIQNLSLLTIVRVKISKIIKRKKK